MPENEAFYIRTLRPFLADATAEERGVLRGFFAQESRHGIAHGLYVERMSELGLSTSRFSRITNFILYRLFEPLQPRALRVSIVAAVEHVNAFMAYIVLSKNLLSDAPDSMRELFYWHFSEEIEHKCVAHDMLCRRYPGYAIRALGAILGFSAFYFASFLGMCVFLKQRGKLFSSRTVEELRDFWIRRGVLAESVRQIRRYFSIRFDPRDLDDSHLMAQAKSLTLRDYAAR